MKKLIHLAIALVSATSLTTAGFAARGGGGDRAAQLPAPTPTPAPPAPITPPPAPAPQDPAAPDNPDDANDDDIAPAPQQQGQDISQGQAAAIGAGAALGALGAVGLVAGGMKANSNRKNASVLVKQAEIAQLREGKQYHEDNVAQEVKDRANELADRIVKIGQEAAAAKTPAEKEAHLVTLRAIHNLDHSQVQGNQHVTDEHKALAEAVIRKANEANPVLGKMEKAKIAARGRPAAEKIAHERLKV